MHLPRLWKKRPQATAGDLQAIPVPDQLILDAQEIVAHHGNSTRPLSRSVNTQLICFRAQKIARQLVPFQHRCQIFCFYCIVKHSVSLFTRPIPNPQSPPPPPPHTHCLQRAICRVLEGAQYRGLNESHLLQRVSQRSSSPQDQREPKHFTVCSEDVVKGGIR